MGSQGDLYVFIVPYFTFETLDCVGKIKIYLTPPFMSHLIMPGMHDTNIFAVYLYLVSLHNELVFLVHIRYI